MANHARAKNVILERVSMGRLLIVDDEARLLWSLETILTHAYTVTSARNGREALSVLESGARFDLVLCDVLMPVMGGCEFHRRLSKMDPSLATRLLMMTGGVLRPWDERYVREKRIPLLEKPFSEKQLRAFLARDRAPD